ncbi:MAG: hypothetical protein GQ540_03675 [Lutibacter sp.]|uniref:hypothetical protein n=1 Tax=Lutibacter sp. TaxID=1925666 RepID=UPI0019EF7BBC|nr:hypothetical protein [Lutibacter sp.]NOR27612.1 hypothetical protein [Lutibacter sp.]
MAVWPGSLPQKPLFGFSETTPDLTIRTSMGVGPDKIRRRFTAGVRQFPMSFQMTTAQVATFDTFYITTLAGGSLQFDYSDLRTGLLKSWRFVGVPRYTPISNERWTVDINLEQMP